MPNALFNVLCKPETLKVGWHLAQLDSRDDFVEDPLRNADFASQLDVRLSYIVEQLASNRYRPRHLIDIDVPKSALTVRPGNVLPIEEAAILHAIVYLIAPKLDSLLSRRVYSYRLHKNWKSRIAKGRSMFSDDDLELPFLKRSTIKRFDPMESWYIAWPEFDAARKAAIANKQYTHVGKTDISAYFENIDLRILEDLLRQRLKYEPRLIALLFRILSAWTRETASGVPIGRGLPQGNDVSSFLGNIYLLPLDRELDKFCERRHATWYRYVDDLDIFAESFEDAREALLLVNRSLRSLHLNLQGSKTTILFGKALQAEYSHEDNDQVGELIGALQSAISKALPSTAIVRRANKIAQRFRRRLPTSIQTLNTKDNRLLRRLMTFYGLAKSAFLKQTALACVEQQPERRLMEKSLRYLCNLDYRHHDRIATTMLTIADDKNHITQYQLASILQAIGHLHPQFPNRIGSSVRRIAFRRGTDWLVRQKAAETLFLLPYRAAAAQRVGDFLLAATQPWVRRAGTLVLLKAKAEVAQVLIDRLVYHPDVSLHLAALLWRRYRDDSVFRRTELRRFTSVGGDRAFMRNVHCLWGLSLNPNSGDAPRFESILGRFDSSESAVVRWHLGELRAKWSGLGVSKVKG